MQVQEKLQRTAKTGRWTIRYKEKQNKKGIIQVQALYIDEGGGKKASRIRNDDDDAADSTLMEKEDDKKTESLREKLVR